MAKRRDRRNRRGGSRRDARAGTKDKGDDILENGLSLDDAKILIAEGEKFGDVYALLKDVERDGERLKSFFVGMTPKSQVIRNGTCTPDTPLPFSMKEQGYTGNLCANCGGSKLIRNGTCELCIECGSTSGCS